MSKEQKAQRDPLEGTQVMSTVATGGGGGMFQARVGALYLANMLTGLPTTFGLHGTRVETLRFEARYTGAHTDDIYCQLRDNEGSRLQLIQCKRGLDSTPGNTEFVDGLQGAWRDFLGAQGSPFDRASDVLVLATIAPATAANRAAKRLCELSRSSLNLSDFVHKVESKLFDAQHRRTWNAFKEVSRNTLADKYTDELVFDLLRRLRVDIHDFGTEGSQELSLTQALLASGQPGDSGEQVWNGLFSYVFEQGITVGTVTRETWRTTAQAGIQEAVDRLTGKTGLGHIAGRFSDRASLQLSLISTKLPNGMHIPRSQCVTEVLAGFDQRQLVIVTGGPGVGKSAVMAELAPLLRESSPLFFFRADELDEPSLAGVQSLNGMQDAVSNMASLLGSGRPTVVIDSLEKALEGRNPGALEELLMLVRRNKAARLCITTRSYALNALYSLFLSEFSYQVVDVPLLTDAEISAAVAETTLEDVVTKDSGVREVLRAPYYLRLALNYTAAGTPLPQAAGNDLRLLLWGERIAPSKGLPAGLAARRRAAFDDVCYARTERFAQFIEAPKDAEAVASLVQDAVLVKDLTDRVAPAHDVLEDWSLFFRAEREVRGAERDWGALFNKLGSHAGMRRAIRTWTAQRSAEGDEDAYALLQAVLRQDSTIPQLWQDEVAIGLLRSERVNELVAKLSNSVSLDSASLLQRLSHLLRVACKGPTSIDYSSLADDSENKEIAARLGMAAPVGKAWDVVIELVARAFPSMPPECNSWVVQLAEDATSHDENWYKPSQRVLNVFNMAEQFCLRDQENWYRENSIGKRFYALLCRCAGADSNRFTTFVESLLQRLLAETDARDFYAEERLAFFVNVKNCREASFFTPDLAWKVFWALYTEPEPGTNQDYSITGWETELGLSHRAAHEFFPPSVLQGPFRSLLLYDWPKSVRFVIDLCNHAATAFAKTSANEITIIPQEQSPNSRPHIHDFRLWAAYRGHSVTSYVLNAALMALEERLLAEATRQPKVVSQVLEIILDLGESSFTTGMVAGVLTAHPELVTEKLLSIFMCPQFFSDDIARSVQEAGSLAIHGGHDGLDSARQQERMASNRLPHRNKYLEILFLGLQFNRPDLRESLYRILDNHLDALKTTSNVSEGWLIGLKRMDARGLKLGEPVGDSTWAPLEIADLDPELQYASDKAQVSMQRLNLIGSVRTWAAAVTGRFATAAPGTSERFSSPSEPYEEFVGLCNEVEGQEADMLAGLEDELACALIRKWPNDTSHALRWARTILLEGAAIRKDKDTWPRQDPSMGVQRAKAVVAIAAYDPTLPRMVEALVNIVTEPMWKLRRAAAKAISDELRSKQPVLAEILTTGLAHYAQALDVTTARPRGRTQDFVLEARMATVKALTIALEKMTPGLRSSPRSLAAIKEWTIVLDAARSEKPSTWRVQSLITLTKLAADQENGPNVRQHDPEHVDFDARRELSGLLASELLMQIDDSSPLFEAFDYCLKIAPELSETILDTMLFECVNSDFTNATAFWRVWDRAKAAVFDEESLRSGSRRSYSRFDKVLTTLLLCSMPWPKTWHNLKLFKSRPHFVADCIIAVGDSRIGLERLLQLMAGVGRMSAVPAALPQLRDALDKSPVDLFDDGNSLWHAETICHVAVHEHREALIRDVNLRRATLDILDRLVDAGSSLGFQLRDYLATSPTGATKH
ncbi:hypothetical protein [Pseudoduganella sp. RAF19]|uniref:hypothetical protein n=2 Tax=unclassified Pseudoduganella TaxID=2637179 RepID=UPI003F9B01F1